MHLNVSRRTTCQALTLLSRLFHIKAGGQKLIYLCPTWREAQVYILILMLLSLEILIIWLILHNTDLQRPPIGQGQGTVEFNPLLWPGAVISHCHMMKLKNNGPKCAQGFGVIKSFYGNY